MHFYTMLGRPPTGIKTRPLHDKGVEGFCISLKTRAKQPLISLLRNI
jgi:hypothetical protein